MKTKDDAIQYVRDRLDAVCGLLIGPLRSCAFEALVLMGEVDRIKAEFARKAFG